MKLNFVLGLALVIFFVMFLFAGSAGADSEVIVGTMGFMGMIALLPLFLFLVVMDAKAKKEREEPKAVPIEEIKEGEPDETEQSTVSQEEPMEDFIKKLREEKGQSETELTDLGSEGDMKKDR